MTSALDELADLGQLVGVDPVDAVDQAEADDERDPTAPYGYLRDGVTPRRKPGPRKGQGKTVRAPKRAPKRAPRASSAASATVAGAVAVDPTMLAGAQTILGIPARMFALSGLTVGISAHRYPEDSPKRRRTQRLATALSADAATLIAHAEPLSAGMATLADVVPWLAGVYAKAAQIGPWERVAETGVVVVLQMLCNHGFLPAHPLLQTVDPQELIAQTMGTPII